MTLFFPLSFRHVIWLSLHPDYIFLMYFVRCQLTVTVTLLLVLGPKVRSRVISAAKTHIKHCAVICVCLAGLYLLMTASCIDYCARGKQKSRPDFVLPSHKSQQFVQLGSTDQTLQNRALQIVSKSVWPSSASLHVQVEAKQSMDRFHNQRACGAWSTLRWGATPFASQQQISSPHWVSGSQMAICDLNGDDQYKARSLTPIFVTWISVREALMFQLWYAHRPPEDDPFRNRAYSQSDVHDTVVPESMKLQVREPDVIYQFTHFIFMLFLCCYPLAFWRAFQFFNGNFCVWFVCCFLFCHIDFLLLEERFRLDSVFMTSIFCPFLYFHLNLSWCGVHVQNSVSHRFREKQRKIEVGHTQLLSLKQDVNVFLSKSSVACDVNRIVVWSQVGISSNGDVDVGEINLSDMDPEDIRVSAVPQWWNLQECSCHCHRTHKEHNGALVSQLYRKTLCHLSLALSASLVVCAIGAPKGRKTDGC